MLTAEQRLALAINAAILSVKTKRQEGEEISLHQESKQIAAYITGQPELIAQVAIECGAIVARVCDKEHGPLTMALHPRDAQGNTHELVVDLPELPCCCEPGTVYDLVSSDISPEQA